MTRFALLFPGQGAQSVGMGRDLHEHSPVARVLLEQTAGDLLDVMFSGPEATLKETRYTQPTILAVSLAALVAFRETFPQAPTFVAGHSLGEFSALVAAGVLDPEIAVTLVEKRAACMAQAPAGTMAVILGLSEAQVEQAVLETRQAHPGVLVVANYNTPEQFVLSGEEAAIDRACDKAKALGASRAMRLPVGGAFHSPLMMEADQAFAQFLEPFVFQDPDIPVITNVDAQVTLTGEALKAKTARQIRSSVRWSETIMAMRDAGVETFVEIGPGKALTGMVKKMFREAHVYNVFDMASLTQTVTALAERIPLSCHPTP